MNEIEYICKGLKEMYVKTGKEEYSLHGMGKVPFPSYAPVEIKAVLEAVLDHLNLAVSIVPPQGQKVALRKPLKSC